jgi:hypothetical protein
MGIDRSRQVLPGPLDWEQVKSYQNEGWRVAAIEWERDVESSEHTATIEPTPYGLRVGHDCTELEEDPNEREVLVSMMELMIQDGPYSFVAEELNRRGYVTRGGGKWSAVSVFEMLPRLIEAGPKIFSSPEWHERRQRTRAERPSLPI